MSIKDGAQPLVSFKKRWTHLIDPTCHQKLAANIVTQQDNRGGGGKEMLKLRINGGNIHILCNK